MASTMPEELTKMMLEKQREQEAKLPETFSLVKSGLLNKLQFTEEEVKTSVSEWLCIIKSRAGME